VGVARRFDGGLRRQRRLRFGCRRGSDATGASWFISGIRFGRYFRSKEVTLSAYQAAPGDWRGARLAYPRQPPAPAVVAWLLPRV